MRVWWGWFLRVVRFASAVFLLRESFYGLSEFCVYGAYSLPLVASYALETFCFCTRALFWPRRICRFLPFCRCVIVPVKCWSRADKYMRHELIYQEEANLTYQRFARATMNVYCETANIFLCHFNYDENMLLCGEQSWIMHYVMFAISWCGFSHERNSIVRRRRTNETNYYYCASRIHNSRKYFNSLAQVNKNKSVGNFLKKSFMAHHGKKSCDW